MWLRSRLVSGRRHALHISLHVIHLHWANDDGRRYQLFAIFLGVNDDTITLLDVLCRHRLSFFRELCVGCE